MIVYGRFSPRRGGWRAGSWWAKAFLRAVEETAYDDAQLQAGRALARSGRVGGLIVDAGSVVASVEDPNLLPASGETGLFSVRLDVPVLDPDAAAALREVVASSPRHLEALLVGNLPHDLVEHLEESGVELLPYGSELAAVCTCRSWHPMCVHALGVWHQVAWLIEPDPLVLIHLRGVDRASLPRPDDGQDTPAHERAGVAPGGAGQAQLLDPVEIAYDAALRARAMLDGRDT